jgi:hypothetical protein
LCVRKDENSKLKIVVLLILIFGAFFLNKGAYAQAVGWYSQITQPERLVDHAKDGCTIMLPYNGAWVPEAIGPYLDEAQEQGIRVLVDLRVESKLLNEQEFRQIIRAHRNHPALYGWHISDEPEYQGTTVDLLGKYYNYCRQEDPIHPVAIVHAKSPYPKYVNCYDLLLIDYYPGWTLYDPDEFNWMVRDSHWRWRDGIQFAKQYDKVGFMAVGLGFGANENGTPNNGTRDLTYAEYRYHVFTAIVQGVDGFLFWWDQWTNSRIKPIIQQMISQVRSIAAEMKNGVTNDPQIIVSKPSNKVVYRYGRNGNVHVILAVNIAGYNVSDSGEKLTGVRFTLPGESQTSQVEVLNEDRMLPVIDGVFIDDFNRFEVHAYKFFSETPDLGLLASPTRLRVEEKN